MFLKKLDIVTNTDQIQTELNQILTQCPWPERNQIGLKYRNGAQDIWTDAAGSLYNKDNGGQISTELDFVNWAIDSSFYIRQEIERLETTLNIKSGRIRFMRLLPKTGLTVHRDTEARYHLVLKTNINAQFGFRSMSTNTELCDLPSVGLIYHVPRDNHWYKADTTQMHWVFNGGVEERIHLVIAET